MAPLLQQQVSVDENVHFPVTIKAGISLKVVASPKKPANEVDFVGNDRALFADPEKKALLSVATREDLNESIGTVLTGVQFSTLEQEQLDELALLVSERGVLFLRQQDYHPDDQVKNFNRLGEIHGDSRASEYGAATINGDQEEQSGWRADASFESNPPSYSFLNVQDTPEFGRDAAWVSQYGLYDELSTHMKGFLNGLHAIHSSRGEDAPVISTHPAVRTHPITGFKALNITPGVVTSFSELKKKESDNLMNFLASHIQSEPQHVVHWTWEPGCIVIWDNRCTAYKAAPSTFASGRPAKRIAIIGEKPYFDPSSESRAERTQRLSHEAEREREKRETAEAIKRRYNNTPLRRILSQQVVSMRPDYQSVVTPEAQCITLISTATPSSQIVDEKPRSRADSVLSAEPSESDSTSDRRDERTALWTKNIQVQIEGPKVAAVPVKRSNTPMRRILERQVSLSSERGFRY